MTSPLSRTWNGLLGLGNTSAPISNPSGGGIAWSATSGLFNWVDSNGNVTTIGPGITFGATQTTPGLSQTSESTAIKGADLVITPQQSTHATDQGGGNLIVNLQTGTGAGVPAALQLNNPSYQIMKVAVTDASHPAVGNIWLGNSDGTTTGTFALQGNSAYTQLNSPTLLYISAGTGASNIAVTANLSGWQFFNGGTPALGGGRNVIGLAKSITNPSSAVTSGSILYCDSSTGNLCFYPPTVTFPTLTVGAGETVLQPNSLSGVSGSPVTGNQVISQLVSQQTVNATPVNALSIPLPGTTGAPITTGSMWTDVVVMMASTTTAVAATFKLSWGWAVQVSGSPVAMGALISVLSTGTNSAAPPTGWLATIALDGTSKNAVITITGDAALTVNCQIQTDTRYVS